MNFALKPWQLWVVAISAWISQQQRELIGYLLTENRATDTRQDRVLNELIPQFINDLQGLAPQQKTNCRSSPVATNRPIPSTPRFLVGEGVRTDGQAVELPSVSYAAGWLSITPHEIARPRRGGRRMIELLPNCSRCAA